MSRDTIAFVVDRLLTDREFGSQFAVKPLETLLEVQCAGFDLTNIETVALVQAEIRTWFCPGVARDWWDRCLDPGLGVES